jgi:RND family efflux transporter MFP subunit
MSACRFSVWLFCPILLLAGPLGGRAAEPPQVPVCLPVVRQVTDYEDFTGRVEPVARVEVRARVTGYLLKAPFKEGDTVKKGDLLFEIDPRPYQIEADRASAEVRRAQVRLTRLARDLDRMKKLPASREEQDRATAERDEAEASLQAARAVLELTKLNLDFCKVQAPIDGRIGRRMVDPGNLVKADETALATIVSEAPAYVSFDVDERTILRLRQAVREGKIGGPAEEKTPVFMGLASEEGFPHKGVVNFADNSVDSSTGTLRLRAVFDNPDHLLIPGLFARIRLPIGKPYQALLVPEEAVSQGGFTGNRRFVYVVDDRNVINERPVRVGGREGDLRVVREGLKAEDRVVIGNLARLRVGMTVSPVQKSIPERPETPRP